MFDESIPSHFPELLRLAAQTTVNTASGDLLNFKRHVGRLVAY
jgi:hypothetical protein